MKLIDANNVFRRVLEQDPTGLTPRNIVQDLQAAREVQIWVWDGADGNARRRKVYPEYKMRRTPPAENINAGFRFMREILKDTTAIQIRCYGWEADDVIATVVRTTQQKLHIQSTDMDLLQLVHEAPGRVTCDAVPKVPLDLIRLFKTAVGDPSDNIPGIKAFGPKAWDAVDKVALRKAIVEDADFPELPKRCVEWAEENRAQLKAFWEIVGLYSVPDEEIKKGMVIGSGNFAAAYAKLKEFML